jgi:hypothetical protein
MTAMLPQYSSRPQFCGLGFGNGIQSVCVLPLVRRIASKGDVT